MELVYLSMPELPNMRNLVMGDRRIINLAAPPDNRVFCFKYERKHRKKPQENRINQEAEAPR